MAFLTWLLLISTSWGYTIAIDPGHGGSDQGASHKNRTEAQLVLQISKKLVRRLNKDSNFNAFLTRHNDSALALRERVYLAKRKRTELFVSIHANSSPDSRSKGFEVYFRNELTPDVNSLRLANQENSQDKEFTGSKPPKLGDLKSIIRDLKRNASLTQSYELGWHLIKNWNVPYSKPRNHAINQGPFRVLQQDHIPSILVEVGFVSNDTEAKRLANPEYQKQMAVALYKGIKDFKETLDKRRTKALK